VPYASNDQLPRPVRSHLPPAAQDIYREAFNHTWQTYGSKPRGEEIAYRIVWAAVKRRYKKSEDGEWRPKE
jgi:cation transport regulator